MVYESACWLAKPGKITRYAYERIESGQRMPGVFEVPTSALIGLVIEDILLLAELSLEGEWGGKIGYIPLK